MGMRLNTFLWLTLWLYAPACAVHECRRELMIETDAPRDSSPCGNADIAELVDTHDSYYYNCEWHCVEYSGECQRVRMSIGYMDGWVQDPEVITEECKTDK
jgi:hypothetical protein